MVMTISRRVGSPNEKSQELPVIVPKELTKRELEILKLISHGLTTSQIAENLFISRKTVETHRSKIMQKLDIHKVSGLVRFVVESKLF